MSQSVNGSKSDLYPEQIRFEEDGACRKRTSLEKCLLVLSVVLFIAVITLAVLFAVYYIKANDDDDDNICTTKDCVVEASKIAVKMDLSVDPCQDFAKYACGQYYKDTTIPDDRRKVSSFTAVNDKKEILMRRIVEEPIKADDYGYVKKMKTYYSNCMDEARIEEMGLEPFTSSKYAKMWPTLNPSWDPSNFVLNDVIAEYENEFVEPIFVYIVSSNYEDSNKHKLHISQPGSFLSIKQLKLARNSSIIMAYQQFCEEVAIILGADNNTASQDAKDLIDFEIELAKIKVTAEESIDISSVNNPSTLRNMSLEYPFLEFHRAVQVAFDIVNMTIPQDLPIINRHPKYFGKLQEVLNAASRRVIMNKFGFTHAFSAIPSTKKVREIRMKFMEVMTGTSKEEPRWKQCLGATTSFIGEGIGKAFVTETFSEDSKKYMDTMIVNLKASFGELLRESTWMEPKTKEAAFLKLHHMKRKLGYPDENFSHEYIEHEYENFTVFDGNLYKTNKLINKLRNMEGLQKLYEPVDKTKWMMLPSAVNAYYASGPNEIAFPAGILQPPFYSAKAPSSINYGAIGGIIGHEITHGFDQSGSQFDYQGNLINWWQLEDLKEYKKRTQCVKDQYSAFEVEEIKMKVNGELTAGENTADIGGLKESFRAYKTYSASQPEELPLPGLGLSTDQQFFLAFAQLWCTKVKPAALASGIMNNVHSPGRFRIKGSLQNNVDFARVFKCPLGSPMNPVKKCVVW